MERDLEHVNRRLQAKRQPPRQPLYRPADVVPTLERFEAHGYREPWALAEGVEVEFWDAGHILGSALTTFEFRSGGRTLRLGMSGDLGRPRAAHPAGPGDPEGRGRAGAGEHLRRPPAPVRGGDRARAAGDRDAHARARGAADRALVRGGPHAGAGGDPARPGRAPRGAGRADLRGQPAGARRHRGLPAAPRVLRRRDARRLREPRGGALRLRAPALREQRRGVQGAQRAHRALHRDRGLGDVRRRPDPPPPALRDRRPEEHRALRRLSGRRHPGPAAAGRRRAW